jgi:hypothetical protein
VFIKKGIFAHKADMGPHTAAKFTNIYDLKQKFWEQLKYYLLIYASVNDDISTLQCISSNDTMILHDELERMCKEVVMTQFKALSQDLLVKIGENYEKLQSEMPAKNLTRHLKKASQKCYHLSHLTWWKKLKMTAHKLLATDSEYVTYQNNTTGTYNHHIYKQNHINH